MNAHEQTIDIALRMPLQGMCLIEASAGTGKTFALTSLALRQLLESGVPLPQLLIVTFTRAATQELRLRLRQRLRLAQTLLDAGQADSRKVNGNRQLEANTQAILAAALEIVGEARVRQRLAAALLQLDEAAVSTIHSFCHRALREHGFRAGVLVEQTVIDDAAEVWTEVAAQLWRKAAHEATDQHDLLRAMWGAPEALSQDLPKLCDPAYDLHPAPDQSPAAANLHALRDRAAVGFSGVMAARGQCTQDQLIDRVWQASARSEFASALAERWPVVLIDEFQDTDARQWDIFQRIYEVADGERRWLCLIGDPKQSIYRFRGGDLRTYLRARTLTERTGTLDTLEDNYRSTPAVLRAIETVFGAHEAPFVDTELRFHRVHAAGSARDNDLRLDDTAVPAMTMHWLPEGDGRNGMRNKEPEFTMMCAAAVDAIVKLLTQGRLREDGVDRALTSADIAVLTQTNEQAQLMQVALTQAGVAAATLSNSSVFASEAAHELRVLLAAVADPIDSSLLRAALSTRLLGLDAAAIAALEQDETATTNYTEMIETAARTWRVRGPLPMLLPFATDAAARWLPEPGGARRLTDLLHLAELLQAESPLRHGVSDQLHWFVEQCDRAANDDARQLRMESDAEQVQIVTIHKSKGLEYPVVVLPFVAWRSEAKTSGIQIDEIHNDAGRPARVWRCKGVLDVADAVATDADVDHEIRAEAQRALYVGMTRAKHALHVVWSRNARTDGTALHWLLHDGERTGRKSDKLDHAGMSTRIEQLAAESTGSIVVVPYDPETSSPRYKPVDVASSVVAAPVARVPRRHFRDRLGLHSFSSLHARGRDSAVYKGADDEPASGLEDVDDARLLGGTAFGNVVHAVLESADAVAWERTIPQWPHAEDVIPPGQQSLIERALRQQGLAVTPSHLAQTARLVSRALNVRLPGDIRLCALASDAYLREMPFHFRLRAVHVEALQRVLDAHGYSHEHHMTTGMLDGLMQGYVDLIYRDREGRHYVLDYKTNRLPGYGAPQLRDAIAAENYDLQYLIYLVALRRWLRWRRGSRFDPARDIGGAVYLFLRGIGSEDGDRSNAQQADAQNVSGLYHDLVSPELLAELDALFDGELR